MDDSIDPGRQSRFFSDNRPHSDSMVPPKSIEPSTELREFPPEGSLPPSATQTSLQMTTAVTDVQSHLQNQTATAHDAGGRSGPASGLRTLAEIRQSLGMPPGDPDLDSRRVDPTEKPRAAIEKVRANRPAQDMSGVDFPMASVEQDSDSGVQGHASNDTGPSSSSNNSTSSSAQDNQLPQPFRYEAPHIQWEVPYPVRRFEGNIPDTIAWDIALTHRLRGRYLTVQKSTESLQGMRAYVAALYDAILQTDDVDNKKSKVKQVDATAVTWIKKRHWREDDVWLMAWILAMDFFAMHLGGETAHRRNLASGVPNFRFHAYGSLAEKFYHVHQLFWRSKAACKSVLDDYMAPISLRYMAAPEAEGLSKRTNNSNRGAAAAGPSVNKRKRMQVETYEDGENESGSGMDRADETLRNTATNSSEDSAAIHRGQPPRKVPRNASTMLARDFTMMSSGSNIRDVTPNMMNAPRTDAARTRQQLFQINHNAESF